MIRTGFALVLAAGAIGVATTAPSAAPAKSCDQQILYQIDSARISAEPDAILIDAFGVAESAGWSKPTLVVVGKGANGVVNVDFVACRPEVSAQVLTPIQSRTTLDLDVGSTHQIVIRAKTNSMTVDITH